MTHSISVSVSLSPPSVSPLSLSPPFLFLSKEGSENEGKAEGVSESETKPDTGLPEVPVPADDTPEVLNKALSGLSSR